MSLAPPANSPRPPPGRLHWIFWALLFTPAGLGFLIYLPNHVADQAIIALPHLVSLGSTLACAIMLACHVRTDVGLKIILGVAFYLFVEVVYMVGLTISCGTSGSFR